MTSSTEAESSGPTSLLDLFRSIARAEAKYLPTELLVNIIEEAVNDLIENDGKVHTATRFCLLSKQLLPYARRALYQTLHIVDSVRYIYDPRSDIDDLLVNSLQTCTGNADAVRRIVVQGERYDVSRMRQLTRNLETILPLCTKLEAVVEVKDTVGLERFCQLGVQAAQLTSLRLGTFFLHDVRKGQTYLLANFSALKHLEFEGLRVGTIDRFGFGNVDNDLVLQLPPPPTFRLVSLIN